MIIRLSKDLEQIIHDAVRAGRYADEDDVIRGALLRLKDEIPKDGQVSRKKAGIARPAQDKRLRDALNQRLIAAGPVSRLPDPALDIDDNDPDDQPIEIPGEPLSETIIRERR